MNIKINIKKTLTITAAALVGTALLIGLADIFLNDMELLGSDTLERFFNITREDSLANWFSTMQTLLVGLTAFSLAVLTKKKGWTILGIFLTFLSMDDGSKFHERVGSAFKDITVESNPDSIFAFIGEGYGWQIALAPLLLAIGIYILIFLYQILTKKAFLGVIIAISLFAFAIVTDYIEGLDLEGQDNHTFKHYQKLTEEISEMLGFTILLITFLKLKLQALPKTKFTLTN